MDRRLIIIVAVAVGVLVLFGTFREPLIIMGYDGIESSVYGFEHPYTTTDNIADTEEGIGSTIATFDPNINLYLPNDPNGVHIEIQEPNVLRYEFVDSKTVETQVGDEIITKTWEIHKVYLEMGVHFWTTGTGYAALSNSRILIRLHENDYSVFTEPDENEAYILNVYTSRMTEQSGGSYNQVSPLASGADIELQTVEYADVPQWILDSGYTGQLTNFEDVAFPITIVTIQRQSVAGIVTSEAENLMYFGIDVLLFGYWESTKPYREFRWDFQDWLKDLWLMLMAPLGMLVAIVAIIGTIIVIWRLPGPWKIFGVVVIWLAVIFVLTIFGVMAIL